MKGGQRRTITAECGWTRAGHPNEVNKLYKLHKKYCITCNASDYDPSKNAFNASKTNGWKGLMPNGQKPTQIETSVFATGRNSSLNANVITEASSVEEATRRVRSLMNNNSLDF